MGIDRHALYGVINETFERPDPALVDRFRKYTVAQIARVTCGKGLMHQDIKPMQRDQRVCGPAATLFGRQGDTLMLQRIGDCIQPGDVIIADVGGVKSLSVTGERLTYYMYRIRGAAGLVVDGAIRDKSGLREMGVPLFFRGVDPKLFGAIGPGAINVRIQGGGAIVEPGDLVVGDCDGVIIVPKGEMESVLAELEGRA